MSGAGERGMEEVIMESGITAGVLKRYVSSLLIPVIPPENHDDFLDILSGNLRYTD